MFLCVFRLHRMHEMQCILIDDRGVCQSVCLSRGNSAAYAACAWFIWCSLCRITVACCFSLLGLWLCLPVKLVAWNDLSLSME